MSEKRIQIGIRMFSDGKELNIGVEKKSKIDPKIWNQRTECPHCKKPIRIIKWIDKQDKIIINHKKL